MRQTITVLNKMETEGVFSRYAIGGGMACLFYMEPFVTFDLDVFVFLKTSDSTSEIVSLSPIYDWLFAKGYRPGKEQILIEGVPVQFLIAYNSLIEDAVRNSLEKEYDGEVTHVFSPEYLAAIMFQTGRPKDSARLCEFIPQSGLDLELLKHILSDHGLDKKIPVLEKLLNE
jgi:hypothetical protein